MFFSGCGLLLLFGGTFHTHTHALAYALSNSSLEARRQSQVRVVATARNPPKLALGGGTVRKTGKMPDFKGVGEKRVSERAPVRQVPRRLPCALSASSFSSGDPRCWFLSLGLRQSKFGSYLQVYGIFACFFWSPNSFSPFS